ARVSGVRVVVDIGFLRIRLPLGGITGSFLGRRVMAAQHFFGGVLLIRLLVAFEVEDAALAGAVLVLGEGALVGDRRLERLANLIVEPRFVEEVEFSRFFLGRRLAGVLGVGPASIQRRLLVELGRRADRL